MHMERPTIFTLTRGAGGVAVALAGVAMLVYPGGTVRDPSTRGYFFFQNFLSDLGMTAAFGGHSNKLGALLFAVSFGILALALVCCSVAFVRLYACSRRQRYLAQAAAAMGTLAAAGLIGAALTPADLSLDLHVKFSLAAIGAAPVSSVLFAIAAAQDDRFSKGVTVGWLALTLVIIVLALMRFGPGIATKQGLTIQVTVQKVVAVAVLVIGAYQTYQADHVVARIRRGAA